MAEKLENQIKLWHKGLLFMFAGFVAGALTNLMSSQSVRFGAGIVSLACLVVGLVLVLVGLCFRKP